MKRNIKRIFSIIAILLCVFILASCEFFDDSTQLRFIKFPKNTYELTDMDNLDDIKASIIIGVTKGDGEEKEYTLKELDIKNAKVTGLDFSYTGKHTLTVKFGTTVISYDYRVVGMENVPGLTGVTFLNNEFYVGGSEDKDFNMHAFQQLVDYIEDNQEFYNKELTINLGTGLYDGHVLIKQFPEFNGVSSIGNPQLKATNKVSMNIYGAVGASGELQTVFNGTIEIVGYGSNVNGSPELSRDETHVTIDGIKFEVEENGDYKLQEPIRLLESCVNIDILNCEFYNCGRVKIGYATNRDVDVSALNAKIANGTISAKEEENLSYYRIKDSNGNSVGAYFKRGHGFSVLIKGCKWYNTDGCIDGYVNDNKDQVNVFENCVGETTRGGFLNVQSSGTILVKSCTINSGGYGIRTTAGQTVKLVLENCTFGVTAESGKYAITFRNNNSNVTLKNVSFTNTNNSIGCTNANGGNIIYLVNETPSAENITFVNIDSSCIHDHE